LCHIPTTDDILKLHDLANPTDISGIVMSFAKMIWDTAATLPQDALLTGKAYKVPSYFVAHHDFCELHIDFAIHELSLAIVMGPLTILILSPTINLVTDCNQFANVWYGLKWKIVEE
jgi:hypothetical protein